MNILKSLTEMLLPRYCKVCGRRLTIGEEHLCITCLLSMPLFKNYKGGMNLPEELLIASHTLVRAESMLVYDKESNYRKILYHLKYYGHPDVAAYLSAIAASRLKSNGFFDGVDLIIPVPLSRKKFRKRGYNQCSYIAKGINKITGIEIEENAIVRTVANTQQAGKGKYQRWGNADGIFMVAKPEMLENKHLLVVDDVMTTGSTLSSILEIIEKTVPSVKLSVFTLALAQ